MASAFAEAMAGQVVKGEAQDLDEEVDPSSVALLGVAAPARVNGKRSRFVDVGFLRRVDGVAGQLVPRDGEPTSIAETVS